MTPDQAKARAIRIAHTSAVPWAEVQGRSREAHIVAARWRIIAALRAEGCSIGTIARTLSKDGATIRNALTRQRDAATAEQCGQE